MYLELNLHKSHEITWHHAHYPLPKCLGGRQEIKLLEADHAIQGVLQSEAYNTDCIYGWEADYLDGELLALHHKWMQYKGWRVGKTNADKPSASWPMRKQQWANVSAAESGLKPYYSFVKNYYEISELKDIVGNFDIVINTTPLTKKTYNLFNKKIFKNMKQGVFFVNVSRGDIVNTIDLKEYVNKNKFSGVGLDIIGSEDFAKKNPFEKFKNVIFTNHLAGITTDNKRRFDLLRKNLKNYINNDHLINTVDPKKQY